MVGCSSSSPTVKNGDVVKVNYTGTLADGTQFDSSVGKQPLQFTVGSGQVIPGFDKAVLGMKVGEKKTVTIPADQAYGPRNDSLVANVSRDQLPADLVPKVGMQLQAGNQVVTVTNVTDTTITIDGNSPLAGKDLTFEIELLSIN